MRGLILNVDRLPFHTKDLKWDNLCNMMEHYQITIAMLQECGINWNCLPRDQQLLSILREKFKFRQCKTRTAHNRQEGVGEKSQWGGTAVLFLGDVCRYAKGVGEDPTGLGRWCWARFQGQDGVTLRCVSVYGPCDSKNGDKSVWQQHIQFLNDNDDPRSPDVAFLEDLEADLKTWLAKGDQVVVGGDFNQELTRGPLPAMFKRNNMHNMVFELHSPEDFPSTSKKAIKKEAHSGWHLWNTQSCPPQCWLSSHQRIPR